METRIGIDLVDVSDVQEVLRRFGQRYLDRVYGEQEVRDCTARTGVSASGLAARFAAKEATLKVLRAGDATIAWTCVQVRRQCDGAPTLELTGAALTLAIQRGWDDFDVSLSHDGGYATAVVLARRSTP